MASNSYYTGERATQAAKYALLFRIISGLSTLVGSVLLVRLLSEEQYGIYNLLYALAPLTISLLSFGLDNSVSRYIPEFVKKNEFRLANRVAQFAQVLRATTSAAVMIALIVFWEHWSGWFKLSEYRNLFIVFSAVLVFYLQYRLLSTILSSYLLQKYSFGARAAVAGAKTAGYAIIWSLDGGLFHVLILELGAYVLATIVLLFVQITRVNHVKGEQKTLGQHSRRRIIRYATFYNFNDVGTFVLGTKFDNFFLAAMLGPTAVGAYSLANTISNLSRQLGPISFFETVIKPVFFSLDRHNQPQEVTRHFQLLVKVACIFNFPVFAFVAIFHGSLVNVIFAAKFQEFSYLIAVVSGFALISRIGVIVSFVAQLAEKAGIVLISKIFIIYNLVALYILVPTLGVLGAAIASGTAALFKEIFIWWHVRNLASLRGLGDFFGRSLVFWAFFLLVSYLLRSFIETPSIELFVGSVIFLATVLLYVRLPLLTLSEREFLHSVLPDRVAMGLSRIGIL